MESINAAAWASSSPQDRRLAVLRMCSPRSSYEVQGSVALPVVHARPSLIRDHVIEVQLYFHPWYLLRRCRE